MPLPVQMDVRFVLESGEQFSEELHEGVALVRGQCCVQPFLVCDVWGFDGVDRGVSWYGLPARRSAARTM